MRKQNILTKISALICSLIIACILAGVFSIDALAAGTSKSNATTMADGELYSGKIASTTQEDWYKVTASTKTSYYKFTLISKNDGNVSMAIYDADESKVESTYVASYDVEKTVYVKMIKGMTYHIKVGEHAGYIGEYNIKCERFDDVADTKQEASEMGMGTLYKDSVITKSDEDWYKVTASNKTSYYKFTLISKNDGYASMDIYDANESKVGSTYDVASYDVEKAVYVKLEKGMTYHIKVGEYAGYIGEYNIKCERFDDVADTKQEASDMEMGTLYKDSVITKSDEDWYKITASTKTSYYKFTFISKNKGYASLDIYDANESSVGSAYVASYDVERNIYIKLKKGMTYYIKVGERLGDIGEYNIKCERFDDIADTKDEAITTTINELYSDSVVNSEDEDWYLINPACYGEISLTMINKGSEYFFVKIVDGNGTAIKNTTVYSGRTEEIKATLNPATKNYIVVSGQSKVEYNFKYSAPVSSISGLIQSADGNWYLYDNGAVRTDYSDLYCDPALGWWKITNGKVDTGYTGIYNSPSYGWWLINGGRLAFEYTGIWGDQQYGWWLIYGGQVAFNYSDLWGDPIYGWWKINNGMVDFNYTGLYASPTFGWWLIGGGAPAFDYNDLWGDPIYGWWKIVGGTIDFGYNGVFDSPTCGSWNIANGQVMFY